MNIFWLHRDITKSARYACDQHIVKMINEYAQQMCTVLRQLGLRPPLKPTHSHHPCVHWVAEDFANFAYLFCLRQEYFKEFVWRYGHNEHKGFWRTYNYIRKTTLRTIRSAYRAHGLDNSGATLAHMKDSPIAYVTVPPLTMPEEFRGTLRGTFDQQIGGVIASYRRFYIGEKSKFARYRTGVVPPFMRQFF